MSGWCATAPARSPASPPVFGEFERIRIINLKHRGDRRKEMIRQLRLVNLGNDPRVKFFPAIVEESPGPFLKTGSHGCFKSFLAILTEAACAQQSVLILEDDCNFIFPAIEQYRFPDRWDIFYGGFKAREPHNLHESDIIGAHFMGFSARAACTAASYLSAFLEPDFPSDTRAAAQPDYNPEIRPPIDGALVWMRRAHPELVTEFSQLGVQRPSRTDIGEQHFLDKLPIVRDLVGFLRLLRSRVSKSLPEVGFGIHER